MAENKEEKVVVVDEDTQKETVVETKKKVKFKDRVTGFVKKHPVGIGVVGASLGMGLAYILGGKVNGGPHTVVNNYDFAGNSSEDEETEEKPETDEEKEEE